MQSVPSWRPSGTTPQPLPSSSRPPPPPLTPTKLTDLPIRDYKVSKFRLGCSIVHASGRPFCAIVDDDPHWGIERRIWHHVLRLQVRHGWLASALRAVARWMPSYIASYLKAWLPGPFLPPAIVVKQRKDDWEDEFTNEICRYEQLKALQGTVIPVFFGTTTMDGTPALVLSDVAGKQLLAVSYSECSRDELEEKLCAALYAVYKLGVSLDDANLVNCHLVDGKVFIVDHEQDEDLENEDRDRLDEIVEGKANHMMRMHWEIHKPKGSPSHSDNEGRR